MNELNQLEVEINNLLECNNNTIICVKQATTNNVLKIGFCFVNLFTKEIGITEWLDDFSYNNFKVIKTLKKYVLSQMNVVECALLKSDNSLSDFLESQHIKYFNSPLGLKVNISKELNLNFKLGNECFYSLIDYLKTDVDSFQFIDFSIDKYVKIDENTVQSLNLAKLFDVVNV